MIGCADGAPLAAPSLNEADYGNVKSIHSVIVQVDRVLFQNVKDCDAAAVVSHISHSGQLVMLRTSLQTWRPMGRGPCMTLE